MSQDIRGTELFRWVPTDAERVNLDEDVAEEYRVMGIPEALSGIVVYAKYRGEWKPNPWTSRPLIKELLRRLNP